MLTSFYLFCRQNQVQFIDTKKYAIENIASVRHIIVLVK